MAILMNGDELMIVDW